MTIPSNPSKVIRFTNGVLASDGEEGSEDLYVCGSTGKILSGVPRDESTTAIDLRGRILSPGVIDVQLNGALGFNFSDVSSEASAEDMSVYGEEFARTCRGLIKTGMTSFCPTLVTADSKPFQLALPFVAPNGHLRDGSLGAESLGAHCEGPFLSLEKKGAHAPSQLKTEVKSARTIEDFYGQSNLTAPVSREYKGAAIKYITVAPERPGMCNAIRQLTKEHDQLIISLGHSAATYEQGLEGVQAGGTMLTHLFNAMQPFLHRSPGLAGLIGASCLDLPKRPYFGLIADDIHVHPSVVRTAWSTHEDGCILTTDGTAATGMDMKDGVYEWKTGRRVVKAGRKLFLEGTDTIAGGTTTLLQCVSNLVRWTGIGVARALKTVTANPARMLGCADVKGTLKAGADADLLILKWDEEQQELVVDEVWKFGQRVFVREEETDGQVD